MPSPDHYRTLGVGSAATPAEIKRAYRKLARKFHPDVSKEADAEARLKDLNAANEALSDPATRAAYDAAAARQPPAAGQASQPGRHRRAPGGANRMDPEADDFLDSLLRRQAGARHGPQAPIAVPGQDHHATLAIPLRDAYLGASRSIGLQLPVADDQGRLHLRERTLEVRIPAGMWAGQQLRLAGQGSPGWGGGPAGDLYLEIAFEPDPRFRVSGRDVSFDVPLAPWEAALGGLVEIDAPDGPLALTVPAGSAPGRQLRLKGRGIPGQPPGHLYAVLAVGWPPADTPAARQAYQALGAAFPDYQARTAPA